MIALFIFSPKIFILLSEPTTNSEFSQVLQVFLFFSDMGRSMIALFIAGFFCMFIAFTTGVVGCWKTAPGHIVSSAIMMLLACKYLLTYII